LHYSGNAAFTIAELSVRAVATATLQAGVAFDYTQINSVGGDGGAKNLPLDLGADHYLPKRTDIYSVCVLQRANGRDSLGPPAVANIASFTSSLTDKQIGFPLGI
jgi:predicted porin